MSNVDLHGLAGGDGEEEGVGEFETTVLDGDGMRHGGLRGSGGGRIGIGLATVVWKGCRGVLLRLLWSFTQGPLLTYKLLLERAESWGSTAWQVR